MRRYIIASHAHVADGLKESLGLLVGERDDVQALSLFVDGHDDVAGLLREIVNAAAADEDVVLCTDILGGSVNNEATKILAERPNTYAVTNMTLPLLINLLFADPEQPTAEVLRALCAAGESAPKFVNDLVEEVTEDEEEF